MNPNHPSPAAPDAAAGRAALVAADRWRLWSSLVRGLSHQMANASQMLALDPVPAGALAEARERIAQAMAVLGALRDSGSAGPTLLPSVIEELERAQRLQMEFPAAPFPVSLDPALPAVAGASEDLFHLLLGMVTLLKSAEPGRRTDLALVARRHPSGAEVLLEDRGGPPAPRPGDALLALAAAVRGELRIAPGGAALQLVLPAWKRPAPAA